MAAKQPLESLKMQSQPVYADGSMTFVSQRSRQISESPAMRLGDQVSAMNLDKVRTSRLTGPERFGDGRLLLTLSVLLMDIGGAATEAVHVGNLCFVAGLGLIIPAQWAILRGDTFSYTVLGALVCQHLCVTLLNAESIATDLGLFFHLGCFYSGYGARLIPFFGVEEAHGGHTPEYYNAVGFFILIWGCFNLFFLIASLPVNFCYILVSLTVECCVIFDGAGHFAMAEGKQDMGANLQKVGGAFGFMAGLCGYWTTADYLCEDKLPFPAPMGDTSRLFGRRKRSE